MNRLKRSLMAVAIAGAVALAPAAYAGSAVTVSAHGHHGGCHGGYSYSTSTSYYYCGGHAAHTHHNGVCPYDGTGSGYYYCGGHAAHVHHNGTCPYSYVNTGTVKKVQKKLNQYGYSCGAADGVVGTKTLKAVKKFQRANGLTADGVIGTKTLKALGLA